MITTTEMVLPLLIADDHLDDRRVLGSLMHKKLFR